MNYTEKIFGFINGIFLFIILLILLNSAAIAGFLGTTMGILIGLLLLIIPFIIGIIFSLKHIIKKTKGFSLIEKAFIAFPLLNLLIIICFIIFLQL